MQSHSVHLLNILRAVEECSVKSKVLPIGQAHFQVCLFSAACLKDGRETHGFSDFVHLQNAVFAKSPMPSGRGGKRLDQAMRHNLS